MPNVIEDLNAYGNGTIFVEIWAKDFEDSGVENTSVLYQMEKELTKIVEQTKSNGMYAINRRGVYNIEDLQKGFHGRAVEIKLFIK